MAAEGTNVVEQLEGWFGGRLPDDWFEDPVPLTVDRDEILVLGRLADVTAAEGSSEEALAAARAGRIQRFREETRHERMRIADEAEALFGRKVSWGAECGDVRRVFTHLAVPVMTRLRVRERLMLDTLIRAGVARTRSQALAWCVRLVARNEAEWLGELRDAIADVQQVRDRGPDAPPQ